MIIRNKTIAARFIRNFIIKIDLVKIIRYFKHEIQSRYEREVGNRSTFLRVIF